MPSPATDIISGDIDVLSEILLYLPPKPLIRFKSVSKQWLTLITSPHFCRRHSSRTSNPAVSGILYRRTPGVNNDADFEYISLDKDSSSSSSSILKSLKFVDDPNGGIKILQSCNGLLLCCSSRVVDNICDYYIYNPTTKQHFTLPRLINDATSNSAILGVNLAFDPHKSPHYKVVALRNISTDYPFSSSYCRIDVYSSETRAWRECGDPFVAPYHMIFSSGVFSNGAIHWINASTSLLYFDVDEERLVQTSLLSNHFGKRRFRYFGESCNNHVHLLDVAGSKTTRFHVFELNGDYSNWCPKYVVDLDRLVVAFPEMVKPYLDDDDFYYAFVILTIIRDEGGDGDESSLLLHIPGKIVSYKFKDGSFKVIRDLTVGQPNSKGPLQFGCLDAYQYIETLASVC